MKRNTTAWALAVIVIAALTGGYAGQVRAAEETGGPLDSRFMVSLGTFFLNTSTKIELDGTAGNTGTVIDAKKDLGMGDADRFRLDATWRFKERHKIRVLYFDVSQSATKTLARDITINDTTYPVSASLTANFSATVTALAYEYAFLKRDNYEITASAGLHTIKFSFDALGTGTVNGNTAQARSETSSVTAPLPVLGLRGLWQFSPKWYLDGQAQYFALKIDQVDGRVTDLRVGVSRTFGEHFGVGIGYNTFTTRVGVEKDNFNGNLRWRYSGAQLFVTAMF